jgi:hypothetical protein
VHAYLLILRKKKPARLFHPERWYWYVQNFTDDPVPGYLGIMITRHQQFCCIFAATKDKFD